MSWFGNVVKSVFNMPRQAYVTMAQVLGGRASAQNLTDTREQAEHFRGWVYVAVHRIATAAMSAEAKVTSDGDDEKGEVPQSKWYSRVIHEPNIYMPREMFTYYRIQQLLLTGESLVWNMPAGDGTRIAGRFIIPTGAATLQPWGGGSYQLNANWAAINLNGKDEDGFQDSPMMTVYNALSHRIPASQVTRVMYPNPLSTVMSYSPLVACAPWIDVESGNNVRWAAHLRNGHAPTVVVTTNYDGSQEEFEAMSSRFAQKYGGTENTSKAIFLNDKDAKVEPLNIPIKDMEYAATSDKMQSNIFSVFGVPGVAAGIAEAGSYAAFVASLRQFHTTTLQPLLDMLAASDRAEIRRFSKGDEAIAKVIIKYTCPPINDEELGIRKATELNQSGWGTINEYREFMGMTPLDGGMGDKLIFEVKNQQAAQGGVAPGGDLPDDSGAEVDDEQIGGFDAEDEQRFTEDPVAKSLPYSDPIMKRFHELTLAGTVADGSY